MRDIIVGLILLWTVVQRMNPRLRGTNSANKRENHSAASSFPINSKQWHPIGSIVTSFLLMGSPKTRIPFRNGSEESWPISFSYILLQSTFSVPLSSLYLFECGRWGTLVNTGKSVLSILCNSVWPTTFLPLWFWTMLINFFFKSRVIFFDSLITWFFWWC